MTIKKLYNSLKRLATLRGSMPDFDEIDWEGNRIRIRPNDPMRRFLTSFSLSEFIPYFDASDISFDIRIVRPKCRAKDILKIEDSIQYEWFLCDKNDRPINISRPNKFQFYETQGQGVIEFSKAIRFKDWNKVHSNELFWTNYNNQTLFRQIKAVHIGHISTLEHYNIAMRFTTNKGVASSYRYMGGFTVFDKDKVRHTILISAIGIVAVAIASVILRSCGFPA